METFRITLETVTPLFLGGADARGAPELRPPAFRGALRYWLRALAGTSSDDKALANLRSVESKVFGSASDRDSTGSAITLRKGAENLSPISYSTVVGAIPKPEGGTKITRQGLSYLLFAARPTKKDDRERNALQGTFDIILQLRGGIFNSELILRQAYAALWLFTHLGGLGSRAKRGGGNLQVTKIDPVPDFANDLPLPIQADSIQQLIRELKMGVAAARSLAGLPRQNMPEKIPDFDALIPGLCKIWVVDEEFESWTEALNKLGLIYQGFRKWRQPDYDTVKDAMQHEVNLSQPVQKAAFGLPVPYLYRSLNGDQSTLQTQDYDRRSSPLTFRVLKLTNQKYALVIVWFKSEFLPDKQKLKLVHHNAERIGDAPDDSLVTNFLFQPDLENGSSLFDKKWNLIEVTI